MPDNQSTATSHSRHWIAKSLKAACWTIVIALVVFVTVCSAIVWFLTPQRLTPVIEKLASDNLDADVTVGHAELTFWKSFPNIKVEVSDIEIVSRSLSSLDDSIRATLPANADSLLSVGYFSGGINLAKAITGKIAINDVIIDRPRINLLQVNDSVANFNILPPSKPDSSKSPIPYISIHHFAITNARPITFNSLSDSIHLDLQLHSTHLDDRGLPVYELSIDTDIDTPLLRDYAMERMSIALDGDINWDGNNPYQVAVDNLSVVLDGIDVVINTAIDFTDRLRIESFDMKVNRLDVNRLRSHAPYDLQSKIKGLDTDMTINLDARLTEPLVVSDSLGIPAMEVAIEIPPCHIHHGDLNFKQFSCAFKIATGADGLNSTILDIDHIIIDGHALDLSLDGSVTQITTDPRYDGRIRAAIDFNRLPSPIKALIPGSLTGSLSADTRLTIALSDLCRENFHRMYADGLLTIDNLHYIDRDSTLETYGHHSTLNFGSRRSVKNDQGSRIDSMLVVKISVDTMSLIQREHHLSVAKFAGAFASSNTHATADTTRINPFGGTVGFDRMTYYSTHDSVFLHLSRAKGLASFRQYRGDARRPQIGVNLDIDRARVTSHDLRSSIRDSHLQLTAHLRRKGQSNTSGKNRRDRSSAGNSRARIISRPRALTAAQLDSIGVETIDFDIDNSLRDILQRWNAVGSIHSSRGSLRIKGMPLRSRMRNLDASFTSDSLALNSLDLTLGRSDFHIAGEISNLRGAMNRRRPTPLRLDLSVESDTIHVNQLVQAATSEIGRKDMLSDSADGDDWDDDEIAKFDDDLHADSITGAVLIPVNLDAGLHVKAANVIYSQLHLEDFRGDVLVDRGVLQLHDVAARNSAGSIRFSALYAAPTEHDISVGLGLILDQFQLGRISTVIPSVLEVLPILKSFSGVVTAKLAATVDLHPNMDLNMSSLRAALNISGDSLAVSDNPTMRTAAKWLMFKNKRITRIDSVNVDIVVRDNLIQVYPFMLSVDRYRLGIMGHSDITQNLDYHVAVLKSPIPFKFGINIRGSAEHPKIRFGGAKMKPDMIAARDNIADTVRVNLIKEMNSVFRRGLKAARLGPLDIKADSLPAIPEPPEPVITPSDSLMLIDAGLLEPKIDIQ